jgi:hypothetical protein
MNYTGSSSWRRIIKMNNDVSATQEAFHEFTTHKDGDPLRKEYWRT